jgi:excisionase family DNA binding protein
MENHLWTPKETATYMHVSASLVYKLAAKGELPSVKIGDCVRFNPDAIEFYINRNNRQIERMQQIEMFPTPQPAYELGFGSQNLRVI